MYFCTFMVFSVFIILSFAFVALILQFDFGTDFFEIDRCLDEGGRWNKDLGTCEHK